MSVTIITGGSSGIGRAVAARMIRHGSVVITGRDRSKTHDVAEELGAVGVPGDVRSAPDMAATVRAATELGPITGLVHSAGVWTQGTVETLTEKAWSDTIDINLTGAFIAARSVLPSLRETGGSIVMIASDFGLVGGPECAAYVASKFGLVGLTKAMALDLASSGVRVNAVCPGDVITPMLENDAADRGLTLDQFLEESAATYPLGRAATVAEVAGVVEFLLSDDSSFMTGASIPIDGGYTAG